MSLMSPGKDILEDNAERLVYLETFGCQMNENDSGRMLSFLKDIKYIQTNTPEKADLIIINTCSIREKAEHKVYSALGRFKTLKRDNPGLVIGVAGCVAQQNGGKLLKRVPYLDIVIGPHNIHRIGDALREVKAHSRKVAAVRLKDVLDPDEYGRTALWGGVKAFVSIMRGCDNFCSYCIVPYTRGSEVSRKSADIIKEVRELAAGGVKEVTLIGQNVNSYGRRGEDVTFPELLKCAAGVAGIERVRFVTSHPRDTSVHLMDLFGEEEKLCRQIHLPVQSGSDRVLGMMRRGYTRGEYLEKVFYLKDRYPDMAVTSDVIVGFPGETEEDFRDTMGLIRAVRFEGIFSFMYSPRPGTDAEKLPGQLPFEVKSERLRVLQEEQRGITEEKMASLVGKTVKVLIEGPSKADPGEYTGRTPCLKAVNLPLASDLTGTVIDVSVVGAWANSLRGAHKERSLLCS